LPLVNEMRAAKVRIWIGGRRQLTNLPGEALVRLGPQFNGHRLADLEPPEALLRQADRHFALAVGGEGKHGLPGGDHLPDFHRTLGHHAVLRRAQHGVTGLVGRDVEFGFDLLEAGFAGAVEVFGVVVGERLTICRSISVL
jgi:hypothetical protein